MGGLPSDLRETWDGADYKKPEGMLPVHYLNNACETSQLTAQPQPPQWQREFHSCIHEYRQLRYLAEETLIRVLNDSISEQLASLCPACFGPRGEDNEASLGKTASDFDVIWCIDGNFNHYRSADAKYDFHQCRPGLFLSEAAVTEAEHLVAATDKAGLRGLGCADSFKAADDGVTSGHHQKTDTGLVMAVCRHDVCLKLVNLFKSGEKLHFAIALLMFFLRADSSARYGVLYDIACNLTTHLDKRKLLADERPRFDLALGAFHAYAHKWACQVAFAPRYLDGFGKSNGEGCERVWSQMRRICGLNREASASLRLTNIETLASTINDHARRRLVKWLRGRLKKSSLALANAKRELNQMQASEPSWTDEHLRRVWFDQREAQRERTAAQREGHAYSKRREVEALILKRSQLEDNVAELWDKISGNDLAGFGEYADLYSQRKDELEAASKKVADALCEIDEPQTFEKVCQLVHLRNQIGVDVQALKDLNSQLEKDVPRGESLGQATKQPLRRKRDLKLQQARKSIASYNKFVVVVHKDLDSGRITLRHRPEPAPELGELLKLEKGASFWTSVYTEAYPWDEPLVRQAIECLHKCDREREELRRIVWEVRRMLRWYGTRTARLQAALQRESAVEEQARADGDTDQASRAEYNILTLNKEYYEMQQLAQAWAADGIWYLYKDTGDYAEQHLQNDGDSPEVLAAVRALNNLQSTRAQFSEEEHDLDDAPDEAEGNPDDISGSFQAMEEELNDIMLSDDPRFTLEA
ncbi:hypothetical protein OIO90_003626 [Microbotryomycetes sp. JL221]|nr:hypothetical protein OIO90_003626 [Microbotryomycetes sp. JL221]